jgi:hypothetical protein
VNVKEALEWSRANGGRHVSRAHPKHGTVGWIAWEDEKFVYRLQFEDLIADDWEPSAETIARVTNGRWSAIEPINEKKP